MTFQEVCVCRGGGQVYVSGRGLGICVGGGQVCVSGGGPVRYKCVCVGGRWSGICRCEWRGGQVYMCGG